MFYQCLVEYQPPLNACLVTEKICLWVTNITRPEELHHCFHSGGYHSRSTATDLSHIVRLARFGLSYTEFSFALDSVKRASSDSNDVNVEVKVTVKNEGSREGSEVVQLYVTYPDIGITTPHLQLKGFGKAHDVAPGESQNVLIRLDKYAFSFWDAKKNMWCVKAGKYRVLLGNSSDKLVLGEDVEILDTLYWSGL